MPGDESVAEDDLVLLAHAAEIRQMLDYTDWVRRRVEQLSFVDEKTVRHRVSVDFKLPDTYAEVRSLRGGHWLVPLALLKKERPLVDFDLFDEEERALPLVDSREGNEISTAMLIATASTLLKQAGDELTPTMADSLQHLVDCRPDEAKEALRDALEPRGGLDGRRLLAGDDRMKRLAADLAQNFLVLAPLSEATKRRVIKFSYRETALVEERGLANTLGWRCFNFNFPTVGPSMAHSYHCEISAPEELEIAEAKLSVVSPSRGKPLDRATPEPTAAKRRRGERRIHLQLREAPSDANGLVKVALRPSSPGLPTAAAMLALGVSLLLSAGVVFHDRVADASESATALLVAVPALIGIYIARPEHLLSRRLLRGVRRLAATVGVLALIAAASTVLHHSSTNGEARTTATASIAQGEDDGNEVILMTWLPLAALSWLATVILVLSVALPQTESQPLAEK